MFRTSCSWILILMVGLTTFAGCGRSADEVKTLPAAASKKRDEEIREQQRKAMEQGMRERAQGPRRR
jgi:hypothetical protein